MVHEQITVEQLIEKRKVMTISKAMIMNIGITSVSSRPNDSASTTITPYIDRLLPASRVLSSREKSNALSKMT